ncbi:MAG: hypothetical protein AB8G86_19730 [Saprospiraceae bacterium]
MRKITKYTQAEAEQAIQEMYQNGVTAGDQNKIIKARKFPKNAFDNFDLFKTYFLSSEGLSDLIKKLSEREIIVLHILVFNQWIVDVSVFEAVYKEMPKPQKYYWRSGTYTQQYGAVLKAVQTNLVQKGLLVKYEASFGGDSKTERQRFMFPATFAAYLPSPFSNLKILTGNGNHTDEGIRKYMMEAIRIRPKQLSSGLAFKDKKLYLNKGFLDLTGIAQLNLRNWRLTTGAYILANQYFEEGKTLGNFVLHHLNQLAPNQWFSEKSIKTLLAVWDDPKKRGELNIDTKYQPRYHPKEWCEAGWKAGILEKQSNGGVAYYRIVSASNESIDFKQYLKFQQDGTLIFNSKTIPLSIWGVLNQLSFFTPSSAITIPAKPDLVHISTLPPEIWANPLIAWLKENAPTYQAAFTAFQKKYGKEIIHGQLMVAKITDLSLRVLVEKGLQKAEQVVVLSDEFIAFPIGAINLVERIVAKSGNVIKRVKQ